MYSHATVAAIPKIITNEIKATTQKLREDSALVDGSMSIFGRLGAGAALVVGFGSTDKSAAVWAGSVGVVVPVATGFGLGAVD